MENLDLSKHSKYFFLGSFIGLIILSIILIKPYITAILGSVILSYLFYPLYKKLLLVVRNKSVASILISLLIIILLVTPTFFIANTLLTESSEFFNKLSDFDFSNIEGKYFEGIFGQNIQISAYFKDALNRILINILQKTDEFIFNLPQKLVSVGVMFFIMFYLFKEGNQLVFLIKREIPLKAKYKRDLEIKFSSTLYATIYGLILTAVLQGIVASIGLYIFKVSSPIILGIVMIILAMLPYLGAALIWLPISVIKVVTGDVFNGVGLFLYGVLIVSTIDNVFRSYIICSKSGVHPVLVLLGVLGGLHIFGFIGIIIGPLTLAILMVFVELYLSEKKVVKIIKNKVRSIR